MSSAVKAVREADIQAEILAEFEADPFVAWAMTTTTGRAKMNGYWVSLGKPGVPDIIGQLTTGQLFGYEVKKPGEKPTEIQTEFIDHINSNGGIASWGVNVLDAVRWLSSLKTEVKPKKKRASKPTKGTRLAEDWELPEEWRQWTVENRPDIDIDLEADKFKDYWLSKSGAGATKIDWLRTWRNWARSAFTSRKKVSHGTHQQANQSDDSYLDTELF